MSVSEARIAANRANATHSTGPKSEAGKARSRSNSLKHGQTGEGVVLLEEDLAEVDRLSRAFRTEMNVYGEIAHALSRRMAVMAVRLERSSDQEIAAITAHVRQTLDEFEPPEGVDADQAEQLRLQAAQIALFDPSKAATLARKYDASAHRGFFQSLKEIRQLKKDSEATTSTAAADRLAEDRAAMARLGSFFPAPAAAPAQAVPKLPQPRPTPQKPDPTPPKVQTAAWDPFPPTHFDLPIAIGRAR